MSPSFSRRSRSTGRRRLVVTVGTVVGVVVAGLGVGRRRRRSVASLASPAALVRLLGLLVGASRCRRALGLRCAVGLGRGLVGLGVLPVVRMHSVRCRSRRFLAGRLGGPGQALLRPGSSSSGRPPGCPAGRRRPGPGAGRRRLARPAAVGGLLLALAAGLLLRLLPRRRRRRLGLGLGRRSASSSRGQALALALLRVAVPLALAAAVPGAGLLRIT